MFGGYLLKRNSNAKSVPMQRVYCVLWGTFLLDFDTEDEAKISLTPRCALEVIGVSKWDGQGRSNLYPNGFLVVTHHGATYYLSAPTNEEKTLWIVNIRAGLECNFANTEIIEYKPSKACFDIPEVTKNTTCPKSGIQLIPSNSNICKCCGKSYSLEHLQENSPILQIGFEETIKVCQDCKDSQACLSWLKSVIYVHTLNLHEHTEEVLQKVDRFKASFKLRRNISTRLNMAAQLKDDGQVDEYEFEALRKIDHDYRQEALLEECDRMKLALEALGNDMQSIIGFLRNPNMTISSSRKDLGGLNSGLRLYYLVVLRLLEVSDDDPDLIDFYWPQVMQVHLLLAKYRTLMSVGMVDMLQQGILAIALKYPYLALKLSWAMLASIGDYKEKKITQSQYCACVLLLLQLEVLTYGVCSCLTDIIHSSPILPHSHGLSKDNSVLQKLLSPAHHQKQELMIEIFTLLRVRKRVHQMNQEEIKKRRLSNLKKAVFSQYDGHPQSQSQSQSTTPNSDGQTNDNINNDNNIDNNNNNSVISTPTNNANNINNSNNNSNNTSGQIYNTTAVSLFLSGCSDPTLLASDSSTLSSSNNNNNNNVNNNNEQITNSSNLPKNNNFSIWKGLSAQLDFTNKLTDLVDTLRFIDRPKRCDHLKSELLSSFVTSDGILTLWGLDPTGAAGEPPYRIHKFFIDDVKVFRTKARAPSLIIFEVVLDCDLNQTLTPNLANGLDLNGHHHHSIVPTDHTNPELYHGLNIINDLTSDISSLVEERMHKTVEEMNRERLNSELSESNDNNDHNNINNINNSNSNHYGTRMNNNNNNNNSLLLSPDRKQLLQKSFSTNDMLPSNNNGNIVSNYPTKTRKLTSTGYINPNPLLNGSNPELDRLSIRLPSSPLTTSSPYDNFDSFQSEGLPDEDIEVTKKVIESANNLLASGAITQEEYNQLVQSDCKYRDEAKLTDSEKTKLKLQSYYGEEWNEKKNRLLGSNWNERESNDSEGGTKQYTEYSIRNRNRARSRSIPDVVELNSPTLPQLNTSNSNNSNFDNDIDDNKDIDGNKDFENNNNNNNNIPIKSNVDENTDSNYIMISDPSNIIPRNHFEIIKNWPKRDIRSFIVKSNDDLRQEVACIQLIELCQEIFYDANLDDMLWLKPYRIVSTGPSAGFVETLPNTLSIDAIKKTNGFVSLPKYFETLYGGSAQRLHTARMNYVSSLAAYSLVTYILNIKDRHNGNILLDSDGHIIHIDFGFLLGIAPGGSFSVETAPFKLTQEMLDVFGGLDSTYFSIFVKAFTTGFLALRAKSTAIITSIEVMSQDSTFPCFQGKDIASIIDRLKYRFRNDLTISETVENCLNLIINSYSNIGTKNYDTFQYYTNGILP